MKRDRVSAATASWTQPESDGTPPTPRHGHTITAVGSHVYVHGGMCGETLHSGMFLLDTGGSSDPLLVLDGCFPNVFKLFSSSFSTSSYIKLK